ncbi:GNAT family N-acetyltransferase [Clostridium sardiniense]|uniref:GNAT family N-acetyltransferase n=1 Tax=Clostridium sardiniense TaxID=29369 RepID=A0ABS7KX01_CLOSR|nr:GNAT family N-acetyltransferase [Clostridium sardiniense]MBY0755321.1 GNAT family N-acetyltransferase [Clostridium sardiniense]MDQ0459766.1 diamine N-acetyltransferase [Clostridium sardiniense]
MNIYLKDINEDNWQECIFLTTNKDNSHSICEEFVASNALSIAQSKIEDGWIIKAIYNETSMIGFTMYGYCYNQKFYEICRLMIDHKYQGNGYGKIALIKIINEMKKFKDCDEIYLSFEHDNKIAQKLYESLNFKDTNKIIDDEILYKLSL